MKDPFSNVFSSDTKDDIDSLDEFAVDNETIFQNGRSSKTPSKLEGDVCRNDVMVTALPSAKTLRGGQTVVALGRHVNGRDLDGRLGSPQQSKSPSPTVWSSHSSATNVSRGSRSDSFLITKGASPFRGQLLFNYLTALEPSVPHLRGG